MHCIATFVLLRPYSRPIQITYNENVKLSYLLLLGFACALIWLIPDTVHFRDSGEFHLVAHYLDISHPAGFPVYAQFANLFSLLPIGPIVLRTHLFSSTVIVLWLLTIVWIANILREKYFPKSPSFLIFFAVLPLVVCFPVWKSASTAEVYGLNAFLLTLCSALYFQFFIKNDYRYLTLLIIVTALTLGNHIASLVILFPLAIVWSYKKIPFSFSISASLLTSLLVLFLYLYLPIRAQVPLPLSSGLPSTFSRFLSVVTNERDGALRPQDQGKDDQNQLEKTIGIFFSDISRLSKEFPRYVSLLGILGFGFLILFSPKIGVTFLVIFTGTLLFFSGWDADPWLPAFGVLSMVSLIPLLAVTHNLSGQSTRQLFSLLIGTFLVFLSYSYLSYTNIKEMLCDTSAEVSAKKTLSKLPANSIFLVEPSWFLLRAYTLLEGERDDVTLLNIPGVLFPRYFNPVRIKNLSENFDASFISLESHFDPRSPAINNIARFINIACKQSPCIFEAHTVLSTILKEVLVLEFDGTVRIRSNEQHSLSGAYLEHILSSINQLKDWGCMNCGSLTYDRWNYAEVLTNNWAELLVQTGHSSEALKVLLTLCDTPEKLRCSSVSVKNLIRLSSLAGNPCGLQNLLSKLSGMQPSVKEATNELIKLCESIPLR